MRPLSALRHFSQWLRRTLAERPAPRLRVPRACLWLEALESRELLAPGDLRIVSYNIASFSGPGAPRSGLDVILRAIGDEVHQGRSQPIDILALQEVQSQATTTQDVVNLLNGIYGAGTYTRGTVNGSVAMAGGTQGIVYRVGSVQLLGEATITVPGWERQALRHQFRPVVGGATGGFYLYNAHFSSGNATQRLSEANAIRADADALGPNAQINYLGDFNVGSYTEASYQRLLAEGNGQAHDPISRPGSWTENEDFVDVFTQAPLLVAPGGLTGGGLDDRFDQQLVTARLFDGMGLDYRFGSLHPFGNNGSVAVNGDVNEDNPPTTALPGLPNRLQVLDLLTTVSDHLPVVVDYTVNAPSALTVRWLAPTRSGFTITFDRPLDPATLNLFDMETGGRGPADITLVGRTTGRIAGSLVVSPDNQNITFVRSAVGGTGTTPGVIPSDTYTITLRSTANGFRDTLGGHLDGNGDGMAGDGFSTLFSIPAPVGVVVSAPEFVRGPGQPVNLPVTATGFPLRLSNGTGIIRVELKVRYDPNLLTITGGMVPTTGVPAGSAVTVDTTTTPGVAMVTFTSPTALAADARNFTLLTATVPNNAPYGSKQVLDVADVRINNGAIATRDDDGLHIVGYFGDASGNGGYGSADALYTLRVAVGRDGATPGFPLVDPLLIADVTGNGLVSSLDAQRLLQEALGTHQPQIPTWPGLPLLIPGGPDPLLSFPRRLRARPGAVVTVPLRLSPSEGLESADLAISYDASPLEVVGVRRGSLTRDFDLFAINHDAESGTLRVGLGRSAGALSGRGPGSVLLITFRIKSDAPAGRTVINLRQNLDGIATLLNDGGLDLNPDPSNQAGDVLDGIITVARRRNRSARIALGPAGR